MNNISQSKYLFILLTLTSFLTPVLRVFYKQKNIYIDSMAFYVSGKCSYKHNQKHLYNHYYYHCALKIMIATSKTLKPLPC